MAKKKNTTKGLDLMDLTFKKVNTVGDLRKLLDRLSKSNIKDNTPLAMFSDEEGNSINGILYLDYDGKNIFLVPWEGKFPHDDD